MNDEDIEAKSGSEQVPVWPFTQLPAAGNDQVRFGSLGGLGGVDFPKDPFEGNPKLVERLRAFAKARGLLVDVDGWFDHALRLAAAEHPQVVVKNRGRPKKMPSPFAEVLGLGDQAESDARRLAEKIDRYNEKQREAGKPVMSDRRFAGHLATFEGHEEGTNTFEANRHKWQKRLGAARKRTR